MRIWRTLVRWFFLFSFVSFRLLFFSPSPYVCKIDIDDPIVMTSASAGGGAGGGGVPEPSAEQVEMLAEMGFTHAQARKALRETVRLPY